MATPVTNFTALSEVLLAPRGVPVPVAVPRFSPLAEDMASTSLGAVEPFESVIRDGHELPSTPARKQLI